MDIRCLLSIKQQANNFTSLLFNTYLRFLQEGESIWLSINHPQLADGNLVHNILQNFFACLPFFILKEGGSRRLHETVMNSFTLNVV